VRNPVAPAASIWSIEKIQNNVFFQNSGNHGLSTVKSFTSAKAECTIKKLDTNKILYRNIFM
jgi:hypothetical protein